MHKEGVTLHHKTDALAVMRPRDGRHNVVHKCTGAVPHGPLQADTA